MKKITDLKAEAFDLFLRLDVLNREASAINEKIRRIMEEINALSIQEGSVIEQEDLCQSQHGESQNLS